MVGRRAGPAAEDVTNEWPGRTFAVIELAMRKLWRGQGSPANSTLISSQGWVSSVCTFSCAPIRARAPGLRVLGLRTRRPGPTVRRRPDLRRDAAAARRDQGTLSGQDQRRQTGLLAYGRRRHAPCSGPPPHMCAPPGKGYAFWRRIQATEQRSSRPRRVARLVSHKLRPRATYSRVIPFKRIPSPRSLGDEPLPGPLDRKRSFPQRSRLGCPHVQASRCSLTDSQRLDDRLEA